MSLYLMPTNEGRRIPLKKTVVFIGRHPDCDVVLNKSLKVSRRHCCLALVDNQLFIRDLGSMNGVQVNGLRVKREQQLRLGDEIVIGDVPFILKSKNMPESAVEAPIPDRTEVLNPMEQLDMAEDLISPREQERVDTDSDLPKLREQSVYELQKNELAHKSEKETPDEFKVAEE